MVYRENGRALAEAGRSVHQIVTLRRNESDWRVRIHEDPFAFHARDEYLIWPN
jgi:hypothetical protein